MVYQQVFRFGQVSANAAKFYLIVEDLFVELENKYFCNQEKNFSLRAVC